MTDNVLLFEALEFFIQLAHYLQLVLAEFLLALVFKRLDGLREICKILLALCQLHIV